MVGAKPPTLSRAIPALRSTAKPRRTCLFSKPIQLARPYSAEAMAAPPLLAKIRSDLKTALKAKDTARLNVLRALIANTLNASKTASPIKTDTQVVALLKRQMTASKEAADEFAKAGREDLVEKEQSQAEILAEYVRDSGLRDITQEELKEIISAVKCEVAADGFQPEQFLRETLKRLMAEGSPLEKTTVNRADVAKLVKEQIK